MALAAVAARVADTPFADWASGSSYAYPAANVLHVLGLVLLLGAIGIVDLRIAGVFPALPLRPLARALTPPAIAGLALLAASGAVLFAADAAALPLNGVFRWKLGLIALALANAAAFRWRYGALGDEPTRAARTMAAASLLLWTGIAVCGRMIAYS